MQEKSAALKQLPVLCKNAKLGGLRQGRVLKAVVALIGVRDISPLFKNCDAFTGCVVSGDMFQKRVLNNQVLRHIQLAPIFTESLQSLLGVRQVLPTCNEKRLGVTVVLLKEKECNHVHHITEAF